MAQYGQLLETYEPALEEMYQAFDDYFNHPTMVKMKDINGHSMYMCKTYCLLSNECRYIVAFVPQDSMPTLTQENLLTLKWVSLQTRTLPDHHQLPSHGYQPKRGGPLQTVIHRIKVGSECSTYECDALPITVTLLHGKHGPNEYQPHGNVIAALETYQTIITLNS